MNDELIRAVVSGPLVIALTASVGVPLRRRWTRGIFGLVLMAAALAPHLGSWRAWAVTIVVVAIVTATPSVKRRPTVIWGEALIVAVIAAAVCDQQSARHAITHVADTRAVVIVIAGLLIAVFVAGQAVGRVLQPFAVKLGDDASPGIENAGRVIGWLERALLYGLILAGAPDAAAIVIAAKSVARFPAFHEEAFAEYYLIGTLLSFIAAGVIGVAVRAALGLPLLSAAA